MQCLFNDAVVYISTIPKKLNETSVSAADAIAAKIKEYAKAMSGDDENENESNGDYMINTKHQDYIDKLRRVHKNTYDSLLKFYTDVLNSSIQDETKLKQMEQFIETNLSKLKIQ
jgi:hypothetical protein